MKISLFFTLFFCAIIMTSGAPAPIFPLVYGAAIPTVVVNGGLATNAALLGLYKLGVAGIAASQLQGEEEESSGYDSQKRVSLVLSILGLSIWSILSGFKSCVDFDFLSIYG